MLHFGRESLAIVTSKRSLEPYFVGITGNQKRFRSIYGILGVAVGGGRRGDGQARKPNLVYVEYITFKRNSGFKRRILLKQMDMLPICSISNEERHKK